MVAQHQRRGLGPPAGTNSRQRNPHRVILPVAHEMVVDLVADVGSASTGAVGADIGMPMLQPRLLYCGQVAPDSYVIEQGAIGRQLNKAAQVRTCGNSVCPPVAAALVRANYAEQGAFRRAA